MKCIRVMTLRLCLGFSVAMLCVAIPCSAQLANQIKQISSNDLDQQGKQLRTEIELEYHKLKDSKTLSLPNTGTGNDISAIILKYIPIGASFEDAERILREADFKLAASSPRPPHPTDASYDRFNIRGGIILEGNLVWQAEVVIILYAETPGAEHTKVKKVFCSIITSSL